MEPLGPILTAFSQFGFGAVIVWFLYYLVTRQLPTQVAVFQQEVAREREMYLRLLSEERELRHRADEATVGVIRDLTRANQEDHKEFLQLLRELHDRAMDRLNVGFGQLSAAADENRTYLERLEETVQEPSAALRRRRRREQPPPAPETQPPGS